MKKYCLVILVSLLTVYISACSGEKPAEVGEYPAETPVTVTQEPGQTAGTAGVQVPEADISVSGEMESAGEDLTEFVRPSNEEIQAALKNAGFYTGAIDGKIGPMSQKAIEDFQQQNGLEVDGKVGRKTWSVLKSYLSSEVQVD